MSKKIAKFKTVDDLLKNLDLKNIDAVEERIHTLNGYHTLFTARYGHLQLKLETAKASIEKRRSMGIDPSPDEMCKHEQEVEICRRINLIPKAIEELRDVYTKLKYNKRK